jgi:DNA repair photolyase
LNKIGITERADPTVHPGWEAWVREGKPAILITKMPRLLYPMLEGNENIIVHCTITGLGGISVEPKIDPPSTSIVYYHLLCKLLGNERVVLRLDPLLSDVSDETYLSLVQEAKGRVRISFLDLYPHVRGRLSQAGGTSQNTFHQPLTERVRLWELLGKPEVCGEPGLPSLACVSKRDCEILGVKPSTTPKGQRKFCECLANKTELCLWPPKCTYGCLYCYWKD